MQDHAPFPGSCKPGHHSSSHPNPTAAHGVRLRPILVIQIALCVRPKQLSKSTKCRHPLGQRLPVDMGRTFLCVESLVCQAALAAKRDSHPTEAN